jgi:hypothetical protein
MSRQKRTAVPTNQPVTVPVMLIEIHCPCGRRLRLNAEAAGVQGRCPVCGRVLDLPAASPGEPALEPAPLPLGPSTALTAGPSAPPPARTSTDKVEPNRQEKNKSITWWPGQDDLGYVVATHRATFNDSVGFYIVAGAVMLIGPVWLLVGVQPEVGCIATAIGVLVGLLLGLNGWKNSKTLLTVRQRGLSIRTWPEGTRDVPSSAIARVTETLLDSNCIAINIILHSGEVCSVPRVTDLPGAIEEIKALLSHGSVPLSTTATPGTSAFQGPPATTCQICGAPLRGEAMATGLCKGCLKRTGGT